MIEFNIDITEVNRLAQIVPAMRSILDEEVERAMEESGQLLTNMTAARTPVNFGILRSSIQFPQGWSVRGRPSTSLVGTVQASEAGPGIVGVSPQVYANYVEFGTRPHWPPIQPLKLWALRKFGDERRAYPTQQRIAVMGTPAYHMFQRAWDEGGQDKVERIFRQVPVRAIRRFEGLMR